MLVYVSYTYGYVLIVAVSIGDLLQTFAVISIAQAKSFAECVLSAGTPKFYADTLLSHLESFLTLSNTKEGK